MMVLAFDIWGSFGCFRRFYTNNSPLTFSIPTPTAVYGMLGALMGLGREEYLKYFNGRNTKVGIKVKNPIKKTRINFNYLKTDDSFHLIKNRIQIRTEFLVNPAYRLFISHRDPSLFSELIWMVKNKENVYSIFLGQANLLADFKFQGVYEAEPVPPDECRSFVTAIRLEDIEQIELEEGRRLFREKLPIDMSPEREVLSYSEVLLETQGKEIKCRLKNGYYLPQLDSYLAFLS